MQEPFERLKQSRIAAGFTSARSAAQRFGWKESTYTAHENGQNDIRREMAVRYAAALNTTADWILLGHRGDSAGIDNQLATLPPDTSKKLIEEFNVMIRTAKMLGKSS